LKERNSLPVGPVVLLLGAILLVVIAAPVAWLIGARVVGIRLTSPQDPLGLVASLGGVMGAIFTAGGLVVALAAVVTLLSVRQQVQAILDAQSRDLTARFAQQDMEIRRQTDGQIQGYITLQQARDAPDWRSAELLTDQALHQYPQLPGARSALGIRLIADVARYAQQQRALSREELPLSSFAGSRMADPPLAQAYQRLHAALEYGDDPAGQVSAALALIFGALGEYDRMIEAMTRSLTMNEGMGDYLRSPNHLILLANACQGNEECLASLGVKLGLTLPVPIDDVASAIDAIPRTGVMQHVDWSVIARSPAWTTGTSLQAQLLPVVYFSLIGDQRGPPLGPAGPTISAFYRRPADRSIGNVPAAPTMDVVRAIAREFHFVCPSPLL